MTVQGFLRVLRERWIVVLAAALVGGLLGVGLYFLRPVEYTARITMYVSAQSGNSADTAYLGGQLSQQRVKSYVELIGDPRVSDEVVRRLKLPATSEEVSSKITATSSLNSVVINVAVVDTDPQRAVTIVNTVGDVMIGLVDELERPTSPTGVPPVAVRVVQPAKTPVTPSSVGIEVLAALGVAMGLAVGIGVALLRNTFDTSVKSLESLEATSGAPNLGLIAYDPAIARSTSTVQSDPQALSLEAYRQLRTNLQFVNVGRPRRLLVVSSSVSGEGKTTTVANLAVAISATGQRVLLIDADLRRPRLSGLFGSDSSAGLTTLLAGRARLDQVIQWSPAGGFDYISSGSLPPNPSELLSSDPMKALLADLRSHYDVILLDTPPLLPVTDAAALAPATDGVILVCRYGTTSRTEIERAVRSISAVSVPVLGTVFTMVPNTGPYSYSSYRPYGENHVSGESKTAPPQQGVVSRDLQNPVGNHALPAKPIHLPAPPQRRPNVPANGRYPGHRAGGQVGQQIS